MYLDFFVVMIMKMLKIILGVGILFLLFISVGCIDNMGIDVNN